ncbi:MAG TPA: diguanylate cyclase [Gaiellaceae bacterium]|nr:diguanylate cyclase [Gaiellaceae bacterium]
MPFRGSGQASPFALTRAGRVYLLVLGAVTVGAGMPFYLRAHDIHSGWVSFAILAAVTTFAQMFPVKSPQNVVYQTSIVFLFAASLLLRPELLVLIPLVQTLPEWVRQRYPLPIEISNVANYTLSALAAWGTADLIRLHETVIASSDARFAVAGLAACGAFVAANHVIVALTLHFVRGHALEATGIFSLDSFSIDLVLSTLGLTLAAFWMWNPWLAFAAIAPLLMVHRSMSIPQLQEEARVDPKTGLYNARYFAGTLEAEIARAQRFDRPMAVIMVDLDLLREINNTYGHLAGDGVLRGVAEIFRSQLRHYDVPARFGGEEFSILLPETPPADAYEIAERIRREVAESRFEVETADVPLRATVSVGVATYPEDGRDANQLIHSADLAVYRAKLQGRNRVFGASEEAFAGAHGPLLRVVSEDGQPLEPLPAVRQRLREAAETIQTQNASLERANRLLRERTTAAMESLSATVDARDAYTAGHSRRVRELALGIGRDLDLSREELEVLGHAALFHDIGKLAVPDSILLKPGSLDDDEWTLMRTHSEEGARIIERLGFLHDAVPSIRHHHEWFDGTGYPMGLAGEEIPLGARIIHVADAFDSMITTRNYQAARHSEAALRELRSGAGSQFCPRCVQALEGILQLDVLVEVDPSLDSVVVA